jgi:hypothetical protein
MTMSPEEYAAAISPHLDRLRLAVMRSAIDAGMRSGLLAESGLGPATFPVFAMLRNAYPDRAVALACYRAAYVYQDPAMFEAALSELLGAGLVEASETVRLTDSGRALTSQVRALNTAAAEGLWGTDPLPVLPLADRCLTAALETMAAEGALGLVAPPNDQPGDSDASRLSERLTGLRWHRFDAHVSAWRSAGLTAAAMGELPDGEQRSAIETATNDLAGAPYAILTEAERSALLQGLQNLPGGA